MAATTATAFGKWTAAKDGCRDDLRAVYGRSKLREIAATIDPQRESAIRIQAFYRGYLVRRQIEHANNACTLLQAWIRGWLCRLRFKKLKQRALIEKRQHERAVRLKWKEALLESLKRNSAKRVQLWEEERQHRAAIKIQAHWRRKLDQMRLSKMRQEKKRVMGNGQQQSQHQPHGEEGSRKGLWRSDEQLSHSLQKQGSGEELFEADPEKRAAIEKRVAELWKFREASVLTKEEEEKISAAFTEAFSEHTRQQKHSLTLARSLRRAQHQAALAYSRLVRGGIPLLKLPLGESQADKYPIPGMADGLSQLKVMHKEAVQSAMLERTKWWRLLKVTRIAYEQYDDSMPSADAARPAMKTAVIDPEKEDNRRRLAASCQRTTSSGMSGGRESSWLACTACGL
ncbi:hypothetical protein CBR_g26246 [Chara braunii]|uniref:Uncharacterized protein n=1 Tax=Chara braunii TaxID=69332 RepID=A0A388L7N4_CHABU|nr:hypothetical protein CBR_g26246 [Chara braunii]|eukprot:GBG78213.1 hypothetical protein CBR_g26246 [Chara braunii]